MQNNNDNIKAVYRINKYNLTIKWRLTNVCNYKCSYCVRSNLRDMDNEFKSDKEIIYNAIPQVARIINLKNKPKVKLFLIGGEVTLFNLEELMSMLLSNLNNNYIDTLAVTTNLSKDADYFVSLSNFLETKGIKLQLTASLHSEFAEFDSFFKKVEVLSKIKNIILKLETVSTSLTKDYVEKFINTCEKLKVDYIVDPDILDTNKEDLILKYKRERKQFKVVFKDDSYDIISTQKELLSKYGNLVLNKMSVEGFYCSLDNDYVYIDKNMHVGFTDDPFLCKHIKCKSYTPLETFVFKDNYTLCENGCSMCGAMSVAKDESELDNYIKSK